MAKTVFYNDTLNKILTGTLDVSTAIYKIMLLSSVYTPNANHLFDDIKNYEITGTGYITKNLENVVFADGKLKADNVTWSGITISNVRYAFVYTDNNIAIAVFDFGSIIEKNVEDLIIDWGIAGGEADTIFKFYQRDVAPYEKFITA
jgi:hypothetical protein